MRIDILLLLVVVFVVSTLLTRQMRAIALSGGVIDVPNARSSHSVPTPRGGGVAIAIVTAAAFVFLALRGVIRIDLLLALVGGGAAVRLGVHFCAALWALAWLGGLPALSIAGKVVQLGWPGYLLGAVGIVWILNLFNFMDGIDGIAASEAVSIAWCGALLSVMTGGSADVPAIGLVVGAACLGFLFWNWPPARIFMGDVGSGYVGYVLAVLAVAATRQNPAAVWIWLILGAAFFVDATVTLVRRAVRGERVQKAHRSHAYQWSARRWGHKRVTMAVSLLNLVWILPSALLATRYPERAVLITAGALAPLVVLALALGAGRREPEIP
jgi:Fuc2NAc and GlcNAc transferase